MESGGGEMCLGGGQLAAFRMGGRGGMVITIDNLGRGHSWFHSTVSLASQASEVPLF